MEKLTYASSGVDIDKGNKAVELIKKRVSSTYSDAVVGDIGMFSGGFSLKEFKHMDEPVLLSATDGVGTKLMIANMMDVHYTIGQDLVAMCVNDLICQGAKPLFFLDYIASAKIIPEKIANIVSGIADGCTIAQCALIGGETAEMPDMYKDDDYDLAGFAVGIADRAKLIDGSRVKTGDRIIGLSSSGLHSNGYALARKLFFEAMGMKVSDKPADSSKTIGELMLEPTKIYVKTVLDIMERFDIKALAHITGGGLLENIPRVLPENHAAKIDTDSWTKPEIYRYILESDKIEQKELYKSFNMGIGMAIVTDEKDAERLCAYINETTLDEAYIIGDIVSGSKEVILT